MLNSIVDPDFCGNCGENIYSCNCCSECGLDIHVCGGVAWHDLMRRIPVSAEFLSEIKELALKIAMRWREENHLQPVEILQAKFYAELQELADASEQWDEIPDVVYYASCLVLQGYYDEMYLVAKEAEERSITSTQLEAGTLAKYRMRVANLYSERPKRIEEERQAILDAVVPALFNQIDR